MERSREVDILTDLLSNIAS